MENLRQKMIKAYTNGNYTEALRLSQELDKYIVKAMREGTR